MTNIPVKTLDVFFLSYDEPNADENFTHLLSVFPHAQRIHGVKGFDAVHKEAANRSKTEYFITVDADTYVFNNLAEAELESEMPLQLFRVRHEVTGAATYAIKAWNKNAFLNLQTHENAGDGNIRAALDFSELEHTVYNQVEYGITSPNSSPFHSFRAAFRESFKCSLALFKPEAFDTRPNMKHINAMSVEQLCCIGVDVKYGLYSMYGANAGLIHAYCNVLEECKGDPKLVTPQLIGDYDFMKKFVDNNLAVIQSPADLQMILDFDWYYRTAKLINISLRQCNAAECQLYRLLIGLPTEKQKSMLDIVNVVEGSKKSIYYKDGYWEGVRVSVDDMTPLLKEIVL